MKYMNDPALNEQYEEHMARIKSKYPKKLYDVYNRMMRFNDASLLGITYNADTMLLRERSDKLILTILSDNDVGEYLFQLEFDWLKSVKFDSQGVSLMDIWKSASMPPVLYQRNLDARAKSNKFTLGDIYYTELDITEQGDFTFELVTLEGFSMYVVFQKCRVVEKRTRF